MDCYITKTGSFLPNSPISNARLPNYLGTLDGEEPTRDKILKMNGIKSRYYALNEKQETTHDLYEMAVNAVQSCLKREHRDVSYLSAGSTNAPLVGPGLSSIIHDRLNKAELIQQNLEINSNSGICSASAQALVNAVRAVKSGEHSSAVAIGVEQPSDILKSSAITPPDDRNEHEDLRKTKWFMSVFLRSMLSDGAGAMLLSSQPSSEGLSFKVNWTYSRSFANEAPLCMTLENRSLLLSQDVTVLSQHMKPCVKKLLQEGFTKNNDSLASYKTVLPHISSFFFKRYMLSVFRDFSRDQPVNYWTNLETAGNMGAASIYIMLDEFKRTKSLKNGDKILLFIPESGQFNFVLISLTVVK